MPLPGESCLVDLAKELLLLGCGKERNRLLVLPAWSGSRTGTITLSSGYLYFGSQSGGFGQSRPDADNHQQHAVPIRLYQRQRGDGVQCSEQELRCAATGTILHRADSLRADACRQLRVAPGSGDSVLSRRVHSSALRYGAIASHKGIQISPKTSARGHRPAGQFRNALVANST
jgi:hypothetical protein